MKKKSGEKLGGGIPPPQGGNGGNFEKIKKRRLQVGSIGEHTPYHRYAEMRYVKTRKWQKTEFFPKKIISKKYTFCETLKIWIKKN